MIPEKPYAISCDKNSEPILEVLKNYLPQQKSLLEVGAGTGQHAIYMAPHFRGLQWTVADLDDRHEGIKMWLKDFPRANIKGPVTYAIGVSDLDFSQFDTVFTANTLHIVSWELCLKLFDDLKAMPQDSLFMVYGAFNYNGTFSSESNKDFQDWLMERFPEGGGIKDFEKVCGALAQYDFFLEKDWSMPSNNQLLVFKKTQRH
jgi:cyclopropane fatty-acyl-phospholipid synthase-like methyltransferase